MSAIPVTFLRRFDVDAVLDGFAEGTVFMGVPTHYARLCASPRLTAERCASMRLFTCGSATLTEPAFAAFTDRTGHRICERYGMSETGITTSNPYNGALSGNTITRSDSGITESWNAGFTVAPMPTATRIGWAKWAWPMAARYPWKNSLRYTPRSSCVMQSLQHT